MVLKIRNIIEAETHDENNQVSVKKKIIQIKSQLPLALLTWIIPLILMGLFE